MDRDFVWEADYGNREETIIATKILLKEQTAKALQNVSYFINNNPYSLEFYVLTSYDSPTEEEIEIMKNLFINAGMKYRIDVTIDSLMHEMKNRRFNMTTFCDYFLVDLYIQNIFFFPERKELERSGYVMEPFSRNKEVFISHSSADKEMIKKIIPYLNGGNHTVWFDEYNINIGDSLYEKIDAGIVNAFVVVFWITESFLKSSWCLRELKLASEEQCNMIMCVDSSVDIDKIPDEVLKYRYLVIDKKESVANNSKMLLDAVLKISV